MSRNKEKKENPPARLLGTMSLLVLGLVAVYATVALGIYSLVQRLVHLEDRNYPAAPPARSSRRRPRPGWPASAATAAPDTTGI